MSPPARISVGAVRLRFSLTRSEPTVAIVVVPGDAGAEIINVSAARLSVLIISLDSNAGRWHVIAA